MTQPPDGISLLQPIKFPESVRRGIHIDVLRLDRLHPVVSGNKWFKLKGHLEQAVFSSCDTIITFGGAWSNHLVATAYAAGEAGLRAVGIVRGQRPAVLSATLTDALQYGMTLEFISRDQYAKKEIALISERYPGAYIIPEGGAGPPGIRGSEEIGRMIDGSGYSHICCAIGTATMFHGLVRAAQPGQVVIGVPVLKGFGPRDNWWTNYHFGGYARHPPELLAFMNEFYRETGVPTDIVYTGKLMYALRDGVRRECFGPAARLLVIHSGGLQGNRSLPPGTLIF
jgi:1-aminocyclopropane-1-carboxylate deaminase/D-cysteine desulfhydrase-like pyridoxal-dependent ACC family enzyme